MRFLRFLTLCVLVAAVYFAQYLFDHRSLADFFPAWIAVFAPQIYRLRNWLPDTLLFVGGWLSLLGALGFGLLAPLWHGDVVADDRLAKRRARSGRVQDVDPATYRLPLRPDGRS